MGKQITMLLILLINMLWAIHSDSFIKYHSICAEYFSHCVLFVMVIFSNINKLFPGLVYTPFELVHEILVLNAC